MDMQLLYELFLKYPEISTDSRQIVPGSLFFALSGENFDGNRFASDAIRKGAAYAIIDDSAQQKSEQYIVVDNVLKTLQNLALWHRDKLNIPVIGITGSNGKTTTKELVIKVLGQKYQVAGTEGNLNNHIGVPLSLLRITSRHEIAVIEMGANHPGEIGFLASLAKPDYGIITNVGKAHLEGFGSFEGVKKTKKELYDYIAQTNGEIILNADDAHLLEMAENTPSVTYSKTNKKADYLVSRFSSSPFAELSWQKAQESQKHHVKSNLPGGFHWTNIMNAVVAGDIFGVLPHNINQAVADYIPSNNRSQVIQSEDNHIFLDAYNANPSSMRAALDYFLSADYPDKLLIIGEMMELGEYSQKEHQDLIDFLKEKENLVEDIFLVGNAFPKKTTPFRHFQNTQELEDYLINNKPKEKSVFIKGSRGNRLESLIKYL